MIVLLTMLVAVVLLISSMNMFTLFALSCYSGSSWSILALPILEGPTIITLLSSCPTEYMSRQSDCHKLADPKLPNSKPRCQPPALAISRPRGRIPQGGSPRFQHMGGSLNSGPCLGLDS